MYDDVLNDLIETHLQVYFKSNSAFKEYIQYALSDGRRFRAKIALDICQSVSQQTRSCDFSALFIEYIHTASLIIDDLPCMDNAIIRRDKNSLHVEYGESIAQLSSFTFISMAIHVLEYDLKKRYLRDEITLSQYHWICGFFMTELSLLLSPSGLVGGQLADLNSDNDTCTTIRKKTGTAFETAFLLGWIVGGGSIEQVQDIRQIASDFAMAFQIFDDIQDIHEDMYNYAIEHGIEKARIDCKMYLHTCKNGMKRFNIYSSFFDNLLSELESYRSQV